MLQLGSDGQLYRTWNQRCFRPTDEPSPPRAAFIELAWADPAAAKRLRLEQRAAYWRARIERLRARLDSAQQALPEARPGVERIAARAEIAAAEAELQAAERRLRDLEAELA